MAEMLLTKTWSRFTASTRPTPPTEACGSEPMEMQLYRTEASPWKHDLTG